MNEEKKISDMHANMNSGGGLSMDIDILTPNPSKEERESSIAHYLAQMTKLMCDEGYIRFMSAIDIAEEYGSSRQFWERLLREGKIPYQQTGSGKVTISLWVEGYLLGKDKYALKKKATREKIIEIEESPTGKGSGIVKCENCGQDSFQYHYNNGQHINGVCRTEGCDFRMQSQK